MHHPTKFSAHRNCSDGNIIVLICHVMSQGHAVKGFYDFMVESTRQCVTNLSNLVSISSIVVETSFSLSLDLKKHLAKRHVTFWERAHHGKLQSCQE